MDLEVLENEEEIWVDCVGYGYKYEVSNLGRVKSKPYTYVNPRNGKKKFYEEKIKNNVKLVKEKSLNKDICVQG